MTTWDKLKVGMHVSFRYMNHTYDGTITKIGNDSVKSAIYGVWNKNGVLMSEDPSHWTGPVHDWTILDDPDKKIKVGSTYLTPTGYKRKVIFADDKGALSENENGTRIWANHKLVGGWTLVPPEEWVNLSRIDKIARVQTSSYVFASQDEAEKDALSGKGTKGYIRSVRVDEGYESVSNG